MDVLCYDPVYQDAKFVESVRRVMKLRHEEGLSTRLQTIAYVPFEEATAAGRLRLAPREPDAAGRVRASRPTT